MNRPRATRPSGEARNLKTYPHQPMGRDYTGHPIRHKDKSILHRGQVDWHPLRHGSSTYNYRKYGPLYTLASNIGVPTHQLVRRQYHTSDPSVHKVFPSIIV